MLQNKEILIVIPARYHSSRFPGKPLALIKGKPMLQWVWDIAQEVMKNNDAVEAVVATEDKRIADFCEHAHMPVVLTSAACESGTARARESVISLAHPASFIINLQGDNALCPAWFVQALVRAYEERPDQPQVITPYVKLDWSELDGLRKTKQETPFSGTCVVCNHSGYAQWFSKQVIPAIRNEQQHRVAQQYSPVKRHIGLYGYHRSVLLSLPSMHASEYESFEGLEQLTFIENSIPIKMIEVEYRGRPGMSGIDSPVDIDRAEAILSRC